MFSNNIKIPMKRCRFVRAILIFSAYILLIFLFSSGAIFYYIIKGAALDARGEVLYNIWRWLPWAFFTPFVIRLVRRFPIEGRGWVYSVPIHILACFLFSFIQVSIYYINIWVYTLSSDFSVPYLLMNFFKAAPLNILTYWAIVGVCYFLDYYRRYRERELRASRLETQLTQSQLQVLKMQLHPHFLFNTLHAISALVYKNPKSADKMISLLSDLLRLSLESSGLQEVPMKEELEFLKIYLEIEKTRFQDRLRIHIDIAPETLDAMIPNLILQPLVENAIRHGIAPLRRGGKISIQSRRQDDKLQVQIDDNGKGLREPSESSQGNGIGLINTRQRLKQLYGDNHRFVLRDGDHGGALVILEIPFRLYEEDRLEIEEETSG